MRKEIIKTVGKHDYKFKELSIMEAGKLRVDFLPRVAPIVTKLKGIADNTSGDDVSFASFLAEHPEDVRSLAQEVVTALPAEYFEDLCNRLLDTCQVHPKEGTDAQRAQWYPMKEWGGFDYLEAPSELFGWLMAGLEVQLSDFFDLLQGTNTTSGG